MSKRTVSDIMSNPNPGQRAAFGLDAPWHDTIPAVTRFDKDGNTFEVPVCNERHTWIAAEVRRGRDYFEDRAAYFGM